MDGEKEKPAKQKPQKEKPQREKPAKPRRERPIEAAEVFVPGEGSVNIQELADAVGVSRPAIRKYLKPKGGAPTTPSAATVCAIARFFGTTPDFLLGFDDPDTEAGRRALESDYYNALGLNQKTIDRLRALRERQADEKLSERAAALMAMLDRQICALAAEAEALLELK